MADEAQLEAVFELCGPRKKDRKISLRKLESLFEEHTNSKVRLLSHLGEKLINLTKRAVAFYVRVGVSLSNPSTPRYVGGSNDRNKITLNSAASMLRRRLKCPVARFRVLAALFLVFFFSLLDLLRRYSVFTQYFMDNA